MCCVQKVLSTFRGGGGEGTGLSVRASPTAVDIWNSSVPDEGQGLTISNQLGNLVELLCLGPN